jgi:hypothetical protein
MGRWATSQNNREAHLKLQAVPACWQRIMRRIASAIIVLLVVGWVTAFFGFGLGSRNRASARGLSFNITPATESWNLYDRDPNHVWNRLYRSLYGRTARDGREYGYDELEPLLWSSTGFLLTNPSNQQAISVLDEFLSTHAERKIRDPLKRAILERDLWAVFDWSAGQPTDTREKLDLQIKLVAVIKKLALSPDEIATLPGTYEQAVRSKAFATAYDPNKAQQPFLPPDLFDPKGGWVSLSSRTGPIARVHVDAFSGRSVFLIFVSLPEGREATLQYLHRLSGFPPSLNDPAGIPDIFSRFSVNPNLPQFPAGTKLALVREMVLIDSQGNLRPTGIVEDVQIRVHRTIPSEIPQALNTSRNEARTALDPVEFKLSRAKLFSAESGGLRPVAAEETEFAVFLTHGIDPFETSFPDSRVSLQACASCHFRPGVFASVLGRGGDTIPSSNLNNEPSETPWWKHRRYEWGLLQGLWQSQPDTAQPANHFEEIR